MTDDSSDTFFAQEPGVPVVPGRDVLVIDDSRTNLQVIGRRLGRMGYRTVLCETGGAAIDLLHGRRFDLILLDMVMPGLSGLATLREIRRLVFAADTPVIMMTARSDSAATVEALAHGADDHVAKPFDFEVLAARIERQLARARAFALLRKANASLDARIADRSAEISEMQVELIDLRADRYRLAASIRALEGEVERLIAGTISPS